jgi:aspartyl-tRNA(Asn)/glutamyl-tRNA(Gln) amidotransferase subunit C
LGHPWALYRRFWERAQYDAGNIARAYHSLYTNNRLFHAAKEQALSVDASTVRRIAHLARIAVAEEEIEPLRNELNAILAFVEQLAEVNVEGVEPMTSVIPITMKKREDKVTDGGIADDIVRNAPASEDHFFLVPRVVE